jgi:hypothetical protein
MTMAKKKAYTAEPTIIADNINRQFKQTSLGGEEY